MRAFWIAVALCVTRTAWAGEFYLETTPSTDKAAVSQMAAEAEAEGLAARVVRRWRGSWEYVLLVEGFDDAKTAERAATVLATKTRQAIAVYEADGGTARQVDTAAPPPEPADEAEESEVVRILDAAVKAHGTADGGLAVLRDSERLLFRFRRFVPGGPTVTHVYAERGADRYLETRIEAGEGTPSRTWLVAGEAWSAAGTEPPATQDRSRAEEVVARFSPEAVLSFPLEFAKAVVQRREFKELWLDGTTTVNGRECHVLRYAGDRSSPPFALAVDATRHVVLRVSFEGDGASVTHEFTDWREGPEGVVLPRQFKTWRGTDLVDEVEVLEVDNNPRLVEEWFVVPGVNP